MPDTPGQPVSVVPAGSPPASAAVGVPAAVPAPIPEQARDDETVLRLWLDGRSPHTARAYGADARVFLEHAGKPLRAVTLGDLQAYAAAVAHLAPASRARKVGAVKSLLGFAHRLGYLAFNVGGAMRLPPIKARLAERIVDEAAVHRLLVLEPAPRNHALLRLLYLGGLRISEACGLTWRDLAARDDAGQVTVFGKGGKTRAVLLQPGLWRELVALRGGVPSGAPVFRSRRGGHLTPKAVHEAVKAAGRRAGLPAGVSAHWLRHAHASHALDRGTPIHLVQATLGHASVATTGKYFHARPNDSSGRYLAG